MRRSEWDECGAVALEVAALAALPAHGPQSETETWQYERGQRSALDNCCTAQGATEEQYVQCK